MKSRGLSCQLQRGITSHLFFAVTARRTTKASFDSGGLLWLTGN